MAAELVLTAETEQDISEAYDWYEKRRDGLGAEFLSCVDASLQRIFRVPEIYTKIHEEYRRALVRRFPYVIFFELTDGMVTVYGVFHTSRNPNKWQERLS